MNTYIISYDLSKPGRNYEALINQIKAYGTWARLGGSAYIIKTDSTVVDVRNLLLNHVDENDKLFVGVVGSPAAWFGLGDEVSEWLRSTL